MKNTDYCCAYAQGEGLTGYDIYLEGYICMLPPASLNSDGSFGLATSTYTITAVCAGSSYLSSAIMVLMGLFVIIGGVF